MTSDVTNTKVVNKCIVNKTGENEFRKQKKENLYVNIMHTLPFDTQGLKYHQEKDEECRAIKESIIKKTNNANFTLKEGIIMYRRKIYLPQNLIGVVFAFYHNSMIGGHLGIYRTQAKVNEHFYNPKMNDNIKQMVKSCIVCKMSKSEQTKYEGKLISVPIEQTMNTVFIDILGPLPRTKNMNQYILVLVDGFSRFVWLYPLRDCKSRLIIEKMKQTFDNFSIPRIIVSDNASYFISKDLKSYLFNNHIQHRRIAAYRANGNRCERYIREINTSLRCYYSHNHTLWDSDLGLIQMSLNTARNSSTNSSAFQIMFYHPCNNALTNLWNVQDIVSNKLTPEEKTENLRRAVNNIKRSIAKNRRRDKYQFPRNNHPFKVNSLVYIKTHYLSKKINKFSKKLAPRYIGPYKILYFISEGTVLVQNVANLEDVRKLHIYDLKLQE